MGIYVSSKVAEGNPETRAVSVQQLSAAQYNGAMVDETGTTIDVTGAELAYLDIATLGTGAASKAVVLNASGEYTYPATATIVYPSSATLTAQSGSTVNIAGTFQVGGVAVTSTAAELNILDGVTATTAEINRLDDSAVVYAEGALIPRVYMATYDTAVDVATVGAHDTGVTIPANSLIIGGGYDVQTTFADGVADLATIAIHVVGANDIVTATTVADASNIWDQGRRDIIPDSTGSTAVKTTAAANVIVTTGTATLTAGKMTIWLLVIPTVVNA